MYGYTISMFGIQIKKYDGNWFSKAMGAGDEFKAAGPVYKLIVQNDGNLVVVAWRLTKGILCLQDGRQEHPNQN